MYRLEFDGGSLTLTSVTVKTGMSAAKELQPGGVCAACLNVTALGDVTVAPGTELTLFREEEQLGVFIAQKPRFRSGFWEIEAYDRVSLLEQELGQWLHALPGWPYTLQQLCDMVLEKCGLEGENPLPRHGEIPVDAFAATGITGRKLLQWICEVSGCFCRATGSGKLEFAWLAPTDTRISPTGDRFYYMDGFSLEDFTVCPVEKVQVQLSETDIGAVYPDDSESLNTLRVTGNYLLTSVTAEKLEQVAQGLYEHLQGFSYTPGRVVTVPCIRAGDIFTVEDEAGRIHTLVAMTCTETDGVLTVESTGSPRRDSSGAVNTARYDAITGRVMNLTADVEGLKMQNREASGSLAELTLQVEGIAATVSRVDTASADVQQQLTKVEQTAQGLKVQVEKLTNSGSGAVTTAAGYTFDDSGLRIAKTGQEMENLLDNTGMYVKRAGDVILMANATGVQATDVTVRNFLIVGSHARLEDYGGDRTACFYLADSQQ